MVEGWMLGVGEDSRSAFTVIECGRHCGIEILTHCDARSRSLKYCGLEK